MDNLKVFKTMGRYVTAQFNAINQTMLAAQPSNATMGLENQLLVDAWNTVANRDCADTVCAC
ncbi:MAG: hypothetical protein RBR82_11455 [Pseudomonas sp.]|nr:hypothetical protein [Pseudomonas sp.]